MSFAFQFVFSFSKYLDRSQTRQIRSDLELLDRPACARSRKAASSRRRCRKNGPGSKQGLCHLIEGLRLASGLEKFLLGQLGTLELQLNQFRIKFIFLKLFEVN